MSREWKVQTCSVAGAGKVDKLKDLAAAVAVLVADDGEDLVAAGVEGALAVGVARVDLAAVPHPLGSRAVLAGIDGFFP